MAERVVWGIHAGRRGEADSLFLRKNVVALGWAHMDDLSKYKTREQFKAAYVRSYPDSPSSSVPSQAGQPFRFVREMKVGNIVVYSSKVDRIVHIGEVLTDYQYAPNVDEGYPHQRGVNWLRDSPRTSFSQGALYELGSAMTLFQIKNYADEYLSALETKPPDIQESEDKSSAISASEIEDQTRDFVIKQLSKNLKGDPLEELIAHLLEKMGYNARLTRTNEPSVDIIAHKDELGFEPPIIKVQVKSDTGKSSDKDVSALYGKLGNNEHGLFVTLGSFSPQAHSFDTSKSNLRLIDGSQLVDLLFEYYDQLDTKYKSIIPMRRVYVPEPISE